MGLLRILIILVHYVLYMVLRNVFYVSDCQHFYNTCRNVVIYIVQSLQEFIKQISTSLNNSLSVFIDFPLSLS